MAIYANLSKLGRVKLPSGNEYALIDVDGRAMLAPNFSTAASYNIGDHVIYGDNLYRFKVDHAAGAWNSEQVDQVTIDGEIKRLESAITGGIHYRGKTTTALYDNATTNPISIGGSSYTAESGDLVIVQLTSVATAYATGTAYSAHTYLVSDGLYYITNAAVTAEENTSLTAIEAKLDTIKSEPEFLFDGTKWNLFGSIAEGLGNLAFKDSASGSYVKATGSGSVTIKNYNETKKYLERTTVVGTDGTVNASEVTGGTTKSQWKQDSTTPTIIVGNADVDEEVTYGTANPGTAVTGIAEVDTQKTFTIEGVKVQVGTGDVSDPQSDCLIFSNAGTGTVYGVKDATGVSITPAVASTSKLHPAKSADSSRTVNNLVSDGNLVGSYTITARTPAKAASSATTIATGGVTTSADGAEVVVDLDEGTESASVTVNTTTDTVTVR